MNKIQYGRAFRWKRNEPDSVTQLQGWNQSTLFDFMRAHTMDAPINNFSGGEQFFFSIKIHIECFDDDEKWSRERVTALSSATQKIGFDRKLQHNDMLCLCVHALLSTLTNCEERRVSRCCRRVGKKSGHNDNPWLLIIMSMKPNRAWKRRKPMINF